MRTQTLGGNVRNKKKKVVKTRQKFETETGGEKEALG